MHFGFPYRVSGPAADYYGLVSPYVMSLLELDEIILSGPFAALAGFPIGSAPSQWPAQAVYAVNGAATAADAVSAGGCQ